MAKKGIISGKNTIISTPKKEGDGNIIIRDITIIPVSSPIIDKGTIIVKDGKIAKIAENKVNIPADSLVVEGAGLIAAPGFVDAHSHIGLIPKGENPDQYDVNESSASITPDMDVSYGIWPQDPGFEDARKGGVTTMLISPGSSNVIGGIGHIVKPVFGSITDMLRGEYGIMKMALGGNPKGDSHQAPVTRMAIAQMIRRAFAEALDYQQERQISKADSKLENKNEKAKKEKGKNPDGANISKKSQSRQDSSSFAKYDYGHENLLLALEGKMPCHIHCSRGDDIVTALRLAREYGLKLAIVHGADIIQVMEQGWNIEGDIILGPLMGFNPHIPETLGSTYENAAKCIKMGLNIALMSDHPFVPVEYFGVQGGLLRRFGIDDDDIMKTMTVNPARILGMADKIGALALGMDGDIVLYDHHPLRLEAKVMGTIIEGQMVYRAK